MLKCKSRRPARGLEETYMRATSRRTASRILVGMVLVVISGTIAVRPAGAIEVGEPAPEFTLPSTFGNDISLRDLRGKKFVLLEFYGADFTPA